MSGGSSARSDGAPGSAGRGGRVPTTGTPRAAARLTAGTGTALRPTRCCGRGSQRGSAEGAQRTAHSTAHGAQPTARGTRRTHAAPDGSTPPRCGSRGRSGLSAAPRRGRARRRRVPGGCGGPHLIYQPRDRGRAQLNSLYSHAQIICKTMESLCRQPKPTAPEARQPGTPRPPHGPPSAAALRIPPVNPSAPTAPHPAALRGEEVMEVRGEERRWGGGGDAQFWRMENAAVAHRGVRSIAAAFVAPEGHRVAPRQSPTCVHRCSHPAAPPHPHQQHSAPPVPPTVQPRSPSWSSTRCPSRNPPRHGPSLHPPLRPPTEPPQEPSTASITEPTAQPPPMAAGPIWHLSACRVGQGDVSSVPSWDGSLQCPPPPSGCPHISGCCAHGLGVSVRPLPCTGDGADPPPPLLSPTPWWGPPVPPSPATLPAQ